MINSFFNISDLSLNELLEILGKKENSKVLHNKNIGLLFEKTSTRTRLSFSVGISHLGGNAIDIKFEDLNFSRDESFEDTFRAMDCYLDGLVYRTDNHTKLIDAANYFKSPIINALSDISHPCQILSDLYTIKEYFGSWNCNILWMGDMNNVCFSLVEAVNLIEEINLTICTPLQLFNKKKWNFNSNISIVHSLEDINLNSVNCIMTDVFISMNDEENEDKLSILKPYIVDLDLINKTAKNSVFMHCLPAKIGIEVSEEVIKSNKSIVWRQAYNRMIAQKKLLHYLYE